MEVAKTSIEGAWYLPQQLENRGVEVLKEAVIATRHFAESIERLLTSTTDAWKGERSDPARNLSGNMISDALTGLREKAIQNKQITVMYRVDDASLNFERGYSEQGESIDPELQKSLDELLLGTLLENNIINKGGVLYQAEKSTLKRDREGNPIKADAEQVKAVIKNQFIQLAQQQITNIECVDYLEQQSLNLG